MNIFCPRCGGYTPPRVQYCRVCGGKVQLLREKMGDVLAAPAKIAAGSMPRAVPAVGAPPRPAEKPAPRPASTPPPMESTELDLGLGGGDLGGSGPLAGLASMGGGSPGGMGFEGLGSLTGGGGNANPFGGGLGDDLGSGLGGDFTGGAGGLDGLGSLGGNLTGGFGNNTGGFGSNTNSGGGLGDLEKLSFGDLGGGGPLSLDDKGGMDGDLGAFSSVNPPFDLGSASQPSPNLDNLDLSIAPGGNKTNSGALFNLDAPSGDFGNLGDFTVSGAGKVDFGDLGAGAKSNAGGKGLFDLDALSASNPSTGMGGGLGSLPSAPEPEIDFSLLSNPDKKKVLKSLEDLDFSKSDLSGSGASKLLDGDLDFTGLSSPAAFKGSEDNLYNMDEMPSLGGTKGPSDDPFATLLNQPARPRGQAPSLINPSDVAEVEKELNKVSAQPAAAASGAALQLIVYQGNKAVKKFPLRDGENTIGQRDDLANINPDIDLADYDQVGLVAPMHCKVYKEGDRYTISDELGSTGTQLNNKPLTKTQRTPIKSGDTVTLAGNLTLKLEP